MVDRSDEVISEERARAVWHRAAQLQAEVTQRLEDRSRSLATQGSEPRPDGFTRSEMEAAAVEAGISAEFVQLALAETGETADSHTRLRGWQDKAATRFLGIQERHIEITRTIAAPAPEVLAAMQRIFPAHPYFLMLTDSVGDPLQGGILLFQLPAYGLGNGVTTPLGQYGAAVDVKQLRVLIRAIGDGGPCEVVLSADLHYGVRRNWWLGTALSGTAGGVGGAFATAVAAKALALGGVILALPAVAGIAMAGGVGALGYGAMYRYYFRKMVETLQQLLQVLDVNARTGGAFASPHPPKRAGDADRPTMIPGSQGW